MFFFVAGRAAMPGVVIWSALRDDLLRAAVRMYGRHWRLVAVAVGGGCSVGALIVLLVRRSRWCRVVHAGAVVPLLLCSGFLQFGGCGPYAASPVTSTRPAWAFWRRRAWTGKKCTVRASLGLYCEKRAWELGTRSGLLPLASPG